MGRLIRSVIGVVLSYVIVTLIRHFLGMEAWWLTLIVSTICTGAVVIGSESGSVSSNVREERIINLHDDSVGEVFEPSAYPGYHKSYSESDGNTYSSSTGGVIMTRFVTAQKDQYIGRWNISSIILCIIDISFMMLLWCILQQNAYSESQVELHLARIGSNLEQAIRTHNRNWETYIEGRSGFVETGITTFFDRILACLRRLFTEHQVW